MECAKFHCQSVNRQTFVFGLDLNISIYGFFSTNIFTVHQLYGRPSVNIPTFGGVAKFAPRVHPLKD